MAVERSWFMRSGSQKEARKKGPAAAVLDRPSGSNEHRFQRIAGDTSMRESRELVLERGNPTAVGCIEDSSAWKDHNKEEKRTFKKGDRQAALDSAEHPDRALQLQRNNRVPCGEPCAQNESSSLRRAAVAFKAERVSSRRETSEKSVSRPALKGPENRGEREKKGSPSALESRLVAALREGNSEVNGQAPEKALKTETSPGKGSRRRGHRSVVGKLSINPRRDPNACCPSPYA